MEKENKKKILCIAEIGHNFNGNMRLAKEMIWEAKRLGADIAKFQCYDIDKIMKPWNPRYMELKFSQLTKEETKELADECQKARIEFMASAFDPERVTWLEELGVKRHKLASRSIYDKETIKAMEETGKPIIVSYGMYKDNIWSDIKNAYNLYCVAEYPATIDKDKFPKKFHRDPIMSLIGGFSGFSDHTIGIEWAKEAIKRGATIIEKHFTLDKKLPGCDQTGSADPTEMMELIKFAREYERQ